VDNLRQAVSWAEKGPALAELNQLLESYNSDACGGPINVQAQRIEDVPDELSLQDPDALVQCLVQSQADNV